MQVKIPCRAESDRGIAQRSILSIAGKTVSVQIRESALFARHLEAVSGRVTVELRTPDTSASPARAAAPRGGLAIVVMA